MECVICVEQRVGLVLDSEIVVCGSSNKERIYFVVFGAGDLLSVCVWVGVSRVDEEYADSEWLFDSDGTVYVDIEFGTLRDGLVRVKVEQIGSRAIFGETDGEGEREGRMVESFCDDIVSARQCEHENASK